MLGLILSDNERLIKIIRRSPIVLGLNLFFPLLIILGTFFLMYPLFIWGNLGITIFSSLILISLIWIFRAAIVWYWQRFIITNQRIIDFDQQGILKKVVSEIPYAEIKNAYYENHGLIQLIARLGNFYLILRDNKTKIEFRDIKTPERILELVGSFRYPARQPSGEFTDWSSQELVNLVKKLKIELGERQFNEIIKEIADHY